MHPTFIRWGNGKKVLIFLHYFGGNANSWQWVAKNISPEFTCIAVHLPGFGNTESLLAPSILNFALIIKSIINKIGIRKYSLIGHSMGGKIALQLAAIDKKNSIKNLILIAPSPPGMELLSPETKIQMLQHQVKKNIIKLVNSLTVSPLSKDKLDVAIKSEISTTKFARFWWVNSGSQQSIINHLKEIKCPVTVLASKTDKAISYDIIKNKVIPLLKNIKFIEIKNSGHLYPLEVPDSIAAEIINIILLLNRKG